MQERITALQTPLSVLMLEDSQEDAELLVLELERCGYQPAYRRVDTAAAMVRALQEPSWDVILSDYSMPQFSVTEALRLLHERELDIPFLIVSATILDEEAIAVMRAGAHDFIMKHRLARLGPAIRREMREAQNRRERRALEEKLRESQKLESIGLLAGGVAHDFNNLLTGILGNASLVLETWSPPPMARQALEDVIRASESAADLTRQLLAYAGKGKFIIGPVNISELVSEIHELIHASISRKAAVLLDLQSGLPPVEADANQIRQLIMNLVINAGEAIGDDHGIILISTGVRALDEAWMRETHQGAEIGPGQYVYLEVHDTGCGMDPSVKAQIFDPFFTTKFTGRGLGLAAALGIVRGHKGLIRVESEPGRGSHFEILLPAVRSATGRSRMTGTTDLRGSGTILLMDGEPLVRRAAAVALESYGYAVQEAENGRQALEFLSRDPGHIILAVLDLVAPAPGAEEVCRQLRRQRPEVEVILCAGSDQLAAIPRGVTADFLKKPYSTAKLAERIKTVLSRRRPRTRTSGAGDILGF